MKFWIKKLPYQYIDLLNVYGIEIFRSPEYSDEYEVKERWQEMAGSTEKGQTFS